MKLELKEITKSFTGKQVLKGISLSANSGTAFGILGRNGAGKTTTIRILMNVFPADSGEILIDGKKIDYKKIKLGYLPEERGLYPKKKINDQLMYFARLNGMTAKEAQKTIDFWLERLGMTEYKDKKLNTLSKGNQQKIQLITAIAHDPDIIILDEPFSGLDPVNAMLLEDVVKEEIAAGKIVLFSSHQMNYIEEFCDSIAILNGGKIVLSGDLKEIKHSFSNNKIAVLTNEKEKITELYGDRCSQNENGEFTGLNIEYVDFHLSIGAEINDIDGVDVKCVMAVYVVKDPSAVYYREDDFIALYLPRFYITCSDKNETFFSQDGKLHYKSSRELVDAFYYTDFEIEYD